MSSTDTDAAMFLAGIMVGVILSAIVIAGIYDYKRSNCEQDLKVINATRSVTCEVGIKAIKVNSNEGNL